MKIRVIDWTSTPGPRFGRLGDFSGEEYRKEIVLPKFRQCLENNEQLEIDLEGPRGYGPSFLDEAFAGLITYEGYTLDEVNRTLVLSSPTRPWFLKDAKQLIENASKQTAKSA